MRILFTFVGGNGHFQPVVPIARAAEAAGHAVAFVSGFSMVSTVEATGFTVFAVGPGAGRTPERGPLYALSTEREDQVLREQLAVAQRVSGLPAFSRCAPSGNPTWWCAKKWTSAV